MPTYYKRDNTGTTDWGLATSWSTVSSTVSTNSGTFPSSTTADPVIFDANSSDCTVNSINRTCTSITFAGYTNTITMSNNITVSGAITFAASMNVSSAGKLLMAATGTITPNGFSWPNDFEFSGTGARVYTLAANFTVLGQITTSGTTSVTINSNTLTCNGFVVGITTVGSSNITVTGGNISGTAACTGAFTINSAGAVTQSGNFAKVNGSLIYTAGTFNNAGFTFALGGTVTLSTGANMVFGNTTFNTSGNYTFNDDIWIAGNLTLGGTHISTYISSTNKNIYVWGLSGGSNNNEPFGTNANKPQIVFNGTGTWAYTGNCSLNITINTLGTLTMTGTKTIGSTNGIMNLTYVAGTMSFTGTPLLNLYGGGTLDVSGVTWPSVRIGTLARITTLISDINIVGTLAIITAAITYNGFNINVDGDLSVSSTSAIAGTTNIVLNGTGTWSHSAQPSNFALPVIINSPSGTVTLSGDIKKAGNLTYTTGTVVATGSILSWYGTMTINSSSLNISNLVCSANSVFTGSNGFDINNLTVDPGVNTIWGGGLTYNILQSLTSVDTQTLNGAAPNRALFTGTNNAVFTAGINPATTMTVSSFVYGSGNLKAGDYVYTNGFSTPWLISSTGSAQGGVGNYTVVSNGVTVTSRTFVDSGSGAPRPYVRLSTSATQNVLATNAVDVDSSQGQTIIVMPNQTVSGTYYYLQNATNWNSSTTPKTSGYTWVS